MKVSAERRSSQGRLFPVATALVGGVLAFTVRDSVAGL
jgi:hypothetical protein